jgi:hypothetical protein
MSRPDRNIPHSHLNTKYKYLCIPYPCPGNKGEKLVTMPVCPYSRVRQKKSRKLKYTREPQILGIEPQEQMLIITKKRIGVQSLVISKEGGVEMPDHIKEMM